jgi:putative selenate reductase
MAQNLVLSWLAGSRILELKTVQILDELELPRPCIDMRNVGYNAEWSQELKLEESLEEYVKGVMLIEMLLTDDDLVPHPSFEPVCYDMSLGYDLAGLRSDRMRDFVKGILNAQPVVDRLRKQIPGDHRDLGDLDYPSRISSTVTLSTFHGCPPNEIAEMCEYLMREVDLDCTIKFNPMLLGKTEVDRLLHDVLGYTDIVVPESAFVNDTKWDQAVGIIDRLDKTATQTGRRLGVKFTNTLVVENKGEFIPASAKEAYLSGPPLHVLAIQLVRGFREHFGDAYPISFSAGIDRVNFPDAVALGLVPITVCTDLLKKGGYGRMGAYYKELVRRMSEQQAATTGDFIIRAYDLGQSALERADVSPSDPAWTAALEALREGKNLRPVVGDDVYERWVSEAKLLNTQHHAERVLEEPRYRLGQNAQLPKTVDSKLELFDCITCDLCIPACPNAANFTFQPAEEAIPVATIRRRGKEWTWEESGKIPLSRRHQIANFADFCNDCGNCDIFCPEEGAPYVIKPRFFGSTEHWQSFPNLDGFFMERQQIHDIVLGRIEGIEYRLDVSDGEARFTAPSSYVTFSIADPAGTVSARGLDEVDVTPALIMDCLRRAILDAPQTSFIKSLYLIERDSL